MNLGPGEVHVWRARVPDDGPIPHWHLLNPEETARAKRYMFEPDRREFAFGRALLRKLLSAYGAGSPESLILQYNEHGKPQLPGLSFNISHSRGVLLYIFTAAGEVGIDVEGIQDKSDREKLVQRFFSKAEIEFYRGRPPEERRQIFFQLWTLKEAFIKANGKGMSYGLDEFSVQWNETGEIALSLPDPEKSKDWTLKLFQPYPDFQGACTVSGKTGIFKFWDGCEWMKTQITELDKL